MYLLKKKEVLCNVLVLTLREVIDGFLSAKVVKYSKRHSRSGISYYLIYIIGYYLFMLSQEKVRRRICGFSKQMIVCRLVLSTNT